MPDILTDITSAVGLGGVGVDAMTAFVMQIAFFTGISFIVMLIMWRTKWYKRILHSYPIHVEILDTRAGGQTIKRDKLGMMKSRGILKGELMKSGDIVNFPALKDLVKDNKGREHYKLQRVDIGVYIPARWKLLNPDSEIVSNFKDLRHAMNMQKLVQRELKAKYTNPNTWERLLPFMLPVAFAIFILIALYANYTYVWLPMLSRVDAESLILKDLLAARAAPVPVPSVIPPIVTPPV